MLVCLAIVCLVVGAASSSPGLAASDALEERLVEYKHQRDHINHADLRAKLERRKDRDGVTIKELVDLLRRTKDKDVAGVVLNKFSVNQLLEMNDFKVGKCTSNELNGRQRNCAQLSANRALHAYCRTLAATFDQWCLDHANEVFEHALRSNGFTADMEKQVQDLESLILADRETSQQVDGADWRDTPARLKFGQAVESVLKAQGSDYEAKIRATCAKMVEIMSGVYLIKENRARYNRVTMFHPNSWTLPYNYCRVVTHLGQPDKLNEVFYNV